MQLNQIQNHLERLYEVSVGPRVEDYLMSEQQMLQTVAAAGTSRVIPEQLFVQQDGDDLALSLYLDAAIVERSQTSDPQDLCVANYYFGLASLVHRKEFATGCKKGRLFTPYI